MIEKIAYRQGVGDLLAEGSLRAARIIGGDAEKYVVHVKGLEVAMHDPRAMKDMRDNYPVTPTGGDHTGAGLKRTSVRNTVGLCQFLQYNDAKALELLNAATGWDMTPEELHETFERGLTLARLFNLREGMTADDDRLPDRLHEPIRMGPLNNHILSRSEIRDYVAGYYEERGWDKEHGRPYTDTLAHLNIDIDEHDVANLTSERPAPLAVGALPYTLSLDDSNGHEE